METELAFETPYFSKKLGCTS